MSILNFPGGIHPNEGVGGKKVTSRLHITDAPQPSRVTIPMSQHIGAPCTPIVAEGDYVKLGQKIGEPNGNMSVAIHSSVSGTVVKVQNVLLANGTTCMAVIIDNDHKDEAVHFSPFIKPNEMTKADLVRVCREMGVVGMGGATFPTGVKINTPEDKPIDTIVVNGAECEPYLSADHRLMVEKSKEIVKGIQLIKKAVNASRVIIGIEKNKPDAIEALKNASRGIEGFEVYGLKVHYPQGGEKQLIYALTGRIVKAGMLPLDEGVIVANVGTCNALYEAVYLGKPVYERVVTVGGCISEPANYRIRIGTLVEWLLDTSKGLTREAKVLIYGGPMMGMPICREDIPVTKGCSGIVALEQAFAAAKESNCIRCGRCVNACPMKLQPIAMDQFIRKDMFDEAEKLNVLSCIECGACTYVCPAKRNLTQSCKMGKNVINRRKKEAAAAKKGGK